MLKTVLSTAILSLGLVTSVIAAPGQPPAIKSWTILTLYPGEELGTTYGTFRTYSSCITSLKSIVRSNPHLREYDGTPLEPYDSEPMLMCVPGTGAFVM